MLRTKLGRRFVVLFVLCALIPVALFGVLADRAVSAELRAQALTRVQRAGKDASTAILQQFTLLDEQLDAATRSATASGIPELPDPRVRHLAMASLHDLTRAQQARAREGRPLLRIARSRGAPVLQMVRQAPVALDSLRIIIADVDLRRVVGGVSGLDLVPPASRLCITAATASFGCMQAIDSDTDGDTPLLGQSTVFLRYAFAAPDLFLTVSEADEAAYAPLQRFRALFIPVALAAVCLAALFAQVTIRRQTAPLSALDAGTQRIAAGDFGHQVVVDSDDEFGQLATAFNGMTRQLDRQFNTLELRHDVDSAVLTAQSREAVIDVVLTQIRQVVECESAMMLVPNALASADARDDWSLLRARTDGPAIAVTLSAAERTELDTVIDARVDLSSASYTRCDQLIRSQHVAVFPVRVNGEVEAALLIGTESLVGVSDADRHRIRQLVAQVAVAFSNLQLLHDLRALNSGALEALARTTDAASPWTAGHSTRVTAIAVALATADGLDEATVDLVRRGALLHDIGKLAVPVAILDKPAALTAAERDLMNTHPAVGMRILQPIAAFAPLLPMVRSHHERWDGKGYPDQLRGEQIHRLARLLAVADVAESMLAARPYRAPLPLDYVVQFVRENAGRHFDPHFAALFAERVTGGDAGLMAALAPYPQTTSDLRLREVA